MPARSLRYNNVIFLFESFLRHTQTVNEKNPSNINLQESTFASYLSNSINCIPGGAYNKVKKLQAFRTTSSNKPLQEGQQNASHIKNGCESIFQNQCRYLYKHIELVNIQLFVT